MIPGRVKWFNEGGGGVHPVATVRASSTPPPPYLPNGPAGSSTGRTPAAPKMSVTREQVEAAWVASFEADGDALLGTLALLGIEVTS